MKQGFAAHQIQINGETHKSVIAIIDQEHRFDVLIPLNRETPFTRFFDGLLEIVCADNVVEDVKSGKIVEVWQTNPYDLFENKKLENSRRYRLL